MDGIPKIDRKAIQDGETFWAHIRRKGGDCDAVFIALGYETFRELPCACTPQSAACTSHVARPKQQVMLTLWSGLQTRCTDSWGPKRPNGVTGGRLGKVALADADRKINEMAVRYE